MRTSIRRYAAFLRGISPMNASMPAEVLEAAGFLEVTTVPVTMWAAWTMCPRPVGKLAARSGSTGVLKSNTTRAPPARLAMKRSVGKTVWLVKRGVTPSHVKNVRRVGSKPTAISPSANVSRSKSTGAEVSALGTGIAAAASRSRFSSRGIVDLEDAQILPKAVR